MMSRQSLPSPGWMRGLRPCAWGGLQVASHGWGPNLSWPRAHPRQPQFPEAEDTSVESQPLPQGAHRPLMEGDAKDRAKSWGCRRQWMGGGHLRPWGVCIPPSLQAQTEFREPHTCSEPTRQLLPFLPADTRPRTATGSATETTGRRGGQREGRGGVPVLDNNRQPWAADLQLLRGNKQKQKMSSLFKPTMLVTCSVTCRQVFLEYVSEGVWPQG